MKMSDVLAAAAQISWCGVSHRSILLAGLGLFVVLGLVVAALYHR